jgi:hypothetical protein
MEMPTPCPTCGNIVELNDMNTCGTCKKLYCDECLERPWGDCDDCQNLIDDEDTTNT